MQGKKGGGGGGDGSECNSPDFFPAVEEEDCAPSTALAGVWCCIILLRNAGSFSAIDVKVSFNCSSIVRTRVGVGILVVAPLTSFAVSSADDAGCGEGELIVLVLGTEVKERELELPATAV